MSPLAAALWLFFLSTYGLGAVIVVALCDRLSPTSTDPKGGTR